MGGMGLLIREMETMVLRMRLSSPGRPTTEAMGIHCCMAKRMEAMKMTPEPPCGLRTPLTNAELSKRFLSSVAMRMELACSLSRLNHLPSTSPLHAQVWEWW